MKLHSIRFKITAITVAVILATVLTVIMVCYAPVRKASERNSVDMMQLICRDTQNNLDEYFESIIF